MGAVWTAALNGGLGLGSYWVARYGFRQAGGWPRGFAACVVGWAWLTIGMQALGSLGQLRRGPMLGWVAALLLIGLVAWRARGTGSAAEPRHPAPARFGWDELISLAVIVWASVLLGVPSLLGPVKVMSDAPIYHLYFAGRWWKAGRLEMIATPFSENAAAYFPAGGDLWLAWLMIGWGGELLAKVGQVPFLWLGGLATHALCRRLNAGRPSATVASAWFVACAPMFIFAFEANVDSVFVAGYLLAVYFYARHATGDGTSALVLGSLAAGLALGTKAPGVVFIPPLLALAGASAFYQGRGWGRKGLALGVVLLTPISVAGFWWVRNAWLTGNPLYPLHLVIAGRVWLSGWYGPGVMKYSPFYIPAGEWRAMVDIILCVLDPRLAPVWLFALAGGWAVADRVRRPGDRVVWWVSALAVVNVVLFWVLIPYRTQQRFIFHAVGLMAVPLSRTFERARWLRSVGVALLVVHMVTRQSWPFSEGEPPWDLDPRVPNYLTGLIHVIPSDPSAIRILVSQPWRIARLVLSLAVGPIALLAVRSWARALEKPSAGACLKSVLATTALAGYAVFLHFPWREDARDRFFPRFPEAYRGWLTLDQLAGPAGTRVAYAGSGLPYYLMGTGLRNEVRYVNVDAHRGWLLHDYHHEAGLGHSSPVTWDAPRPGWDRIHPDYPAWIDNLRDAGIRFLVVARTNPDEGVHNIATPDHFTIERVWADSHPETFEPVYGDPQFRIYRIKPGPGSAKLEK